MCALRCPRQHIQSRSSRCSSQAAQLQHTAPGVPRGDTKPLPHNTTPDSPCKTHHQHTWDTTRQDTTVLQGQLIRTQVTSGIASHPATTGQAIIHVNVTVRERTFEGTAGRHSTCCPTVGRGLQQRRAPCLEPAVQAPALLNISAHVKQTTSCCYAIAVEQQLATTLRTPCRAQPATSPDTAPSHCTISRPGCRQVRSGS
jgi:hypothetical protein